MDNFLPGADGVVLIWDMLLSLSPVGLVTAELADGSTSATARLREPLAAAAALTRNSLVFDFEANNLLVNIGEHKIK